MRHPLRLASVLLALTGSVALATSFGSAGCSSDDSETSGDDDAGLDSSAADASTFNEDSGDDASFTDDAATVTACTLHSQTNDPVGLCSQKIIFKAWKAATRVPAGVASSWNAATGIPTLDGSTAVHDFHDDLGYGAAIADYHRSATCYGDTQLTATLDNDLVALEPTLLAELSPLPAEYRGDTYFRLRRIAAGLRYVNQTTEGDAIDGVAEAYGRALASSYFVDLGPASFGMADAGAGTGTGSDAGDASAPTDGGTRVTDAGDGGLVFEDGIIGTPTGGAADYTVGTSALAALALLDLASRHTSDNLTGAQVFEAASIGTFNHLFNRARDASGLYFTRLSTATSGAHDTSADTSGVFSADVQAEVAYAFLEATKIAQANGALRLANAFPLLADGEQVLAAVNGTPSLYDAVSTGYLATIAPATSTLATTKTTRSNALMLAALRDDLLDDGTAGVDTTIAIGQLPKLKALLLTFAPATGLNGVVNGQPGLVDVATSTFGPSPATGTTYSSAATAAALSALNHELPAECGE